MTTAVQTQQSAALQKFNSVATLLQSDKVQAAIAMALPKHMSAERMIRVAMTALQKTPKLAECDQRSLVNALVQASELGLEPNTPLGEAYLIPYFNKNTKRTEAQLMPGYRGLIKLARQSEKIDGIYAEIVYEKDFFEITYGLNKDLTHKPDLNAEDRGKMIGVYAVAKFKDGYTDFEYMSAIEVEKIRKRSKSPDNGPWVTDTGEMWRKTPIRRICKRLPQSVEDKALQKAIEIDNAYNIDMTDIAPLELGNGDAPEVITEEQRIALVDAAKASGQDLTAIVNAAGFELIAHITVDRYDELFAIVSTSPADTLPKSDDTPDVTHTDAQIMENQASEEESAADQETKQAEMKLADLKIAVMEAYRGLEAQRKIDAATWLGTREIKNLTREEMEQFLDTFAA